MRVKETLTVSSAVGLVVLRPVVDGRLPQFLQKLQRPLQVGGSERTAETGIICRPEDFSTLSQHVQLKLEDENRNIFSSIFPTVEPNGGNLGLNLNLEVKANYQELPGGLRLTVQLGDR